jgi:hypothetical protein
MNTINEGRYEDTNRIFEIPTDYSYKVTDWSDNNKYKILSKIDGV